MPRAKVSTTSGRKQALVVRSDLGMSTGKICAAVCYAVQPVDKRVFYKANRERFEELEHSARRLEGVIVTRHLSPTSEPETVTLLSLVGQERVVDTLVKGMRLL